MRSSASASTGSCRGEARANLCGGGVRPLGKRLLDTEAAVEREAQRREWGATRRGLVTEGFVLRGELPVSLRLLGQLEDRGSTLELTEEDGAEQRLASTALIRPPVRQPIAQRARAGLGDPVDPAPSRPGLPGDLDDRSLLDEQPRELRVDLAAVCGRLAASGAAAG